MRYRYFDTDLLLLELVNAQTASVDLQDSATAIKVPAKNKSKDKTHKEALVLASEPLLKLYNTVCEFIDGLGACRT